jgi:hypothetical protein
LDARWGNGFFNDWRGHYLDDLSAGAIRILMDHSERLNSPWTDIKIAHLEGAVSRVPEGATAYGSRNAKFGLAIQARWERGSDSTAQVAWAKGLRDALAPYTTGRAYANFIAADEADRVRWAHGPENYRRLRELKSKYSCVHFIASLGSPQWQKAKATIGRPTHSFGIMGKGGASRRKNQVVSSSGSWEIRLR